MPEPRISGFSSKHRLPIHEVRTRDQEGRECYFFLMCPHQKIRMLQHQLKDTSSPMIDLRQYGAIIASGFGRVSAANRKLLKENYGFDVTMVST
jgi:hypothetical protein